MKNQKLKPHQVWDPRWPDKLGKYQDRIPRYVLAELTQENWPLCEEFNSCSSTLKSSELICLPQFRAEEKKSRRRGASKISDGNLIKPGGYHEYDRQISLHNQVPTRPGNWHDFFNFVIWASFPITKYALHGLGYRAANEYLKNNSFNRSRINDLVTLFDEGGVAIIIFDQELYNTLIVRDTLSLSEIGPKYQDDIQCVIFGHALLESIFFGRCTINAFGLMLLADKTSKPTSPKESIYFRDLDGIMSRFFSQTSIEEKDFKRTSFALSQLL